MAILLFFHPTAIMALDAGTICSDQSTLLGASADDLQPTTRVNSVGVNISQYGGAGGDYTSEKIWTNAMRSHRCWSKPSSSISAADASLDAAGWPTEDAQCLVYHGLSTGNNYGTYKLSFECNNPSGVTITSTTASVENKANTGNTVTCDVVISDVDNMMLFLTFRNTSGGVRNVKLMRPLTPGSKNSYQDSTIFTDEVLKTVEPFDVLRYHHWMRTTHPGCDSLWILRTQWGYATQQPKNPYANGWGKSQPPWETLIRFANTTGKDAWICIPIRATDDYVTNLAVLFRDGNPVCGPLNPKLKIYVEYANEVWNMGIYTKQAAWIKGQLQKYPELTFDGETNQTTIYHRYVAMRTVQISNIFRSVFGDGQMMSRIRPVICHQKANIDVMNRTMTFADRYYNKMDPRSTWGDPHPLNYYFYSFSTGIYWRPVDAPPALTIDNVWGNGEWDPSTYYNGLKIGPVMAKAYGLHYLSYESGPHPRYNGDEVVLSDAAIDLRMRAKQIEMHRIFNQFDGEVNVLFTLITSGGAFDILRGDIGNQDRPRYQAVLDIKNEAPAGVTLGSLAPFIRDGHDYDLEGTWGAPAGTGNYSITAQSSNYFAAYCFRVKEQGAYNVKVEYSTTDDATLIVEYAGEVIGNFKVASTQGVAAYTTGINISCDPEKLYAIKLSAKEGTVTIKSITVDIGTRVNELKDKTGMRKDINLYPNPTCDVVIIEIANSYANSVNIQMYDMKGKKVLDTRQQVFKGNNLVSLSTARLVDGIYSLKVIVKSQTSVGKIIIKR